MPAKASVIPRNCRTLESPAGCRVRRRQGIRLKPPTLRLVGSKVIQPAPGTKSSAHAWVDPHHSIRGFADRDCRDSQRRYARRTQGCAPRPQRAPRNPDTIPSRDPEFGLETECPRHPGSDSGSSSLRRHSGLSAATACQSIGRGQMPAPNRATAPSGPGIAVSSKRRDQSIHRRNTETGRQLRRRQC